MVLWFADEGTGGHQGREGLVWAVLCVLLCEERYPSVGSEWRNKGERGTAIAAARLKSCRAGRQNECRGRWGTVTSSPYLFSACEGKGVVVGQKSPPRCLGSSSPSGLPSTPLLLWETQDKREGGYLGQPDLDPPPPSESDPVVWVT